MTGRKRGEYFEAGVRLVWSVDPERRTVTVYRGPDDLEVLTQEQTLDGGEVMPGFSAKLADIFAELDRKGGA